VAQRSFESAFKGRAPGSGAGDSLSSFKLSWQRYRERTEKVGIRIREGGYMSTASQVKGKKGGEIARRTERLLHLEPMKHGILH